MERWLLIDDYLRSHMGTTDAHSASVSVPWANGLGHTSYRVTPAIARRARQRLKRLTAPTARRVRSSSVKSPRPKYSASRDLQAG